MTTTDVSMKSLLEAGVHFGHRTRRWNPKMRSYIFTERNGIHIIDLAQTLEQLERAYGMVRDTAASGGVVLFVGTKRQSQEVIAREAERANMPYVNHRWLGGTLTNFQTIRRRVRYLRDLEGRQARGELTALPKKEMIEAEREIEKLNRRLGGIKYMETIPDLIFVIDVRREDIAVKEANTLKIPAIAMVDTNCDPTPIDVVIPSNDDAIRAIKLITAYLADAAAEGRMMYDAKYVEELGQREDFRATDTSRRLFSPSDEPEEFDEIYEDEDDVDFVAFEDSDEEA